MMNGAESTRRALAIAMALLCVYLFVAYELDADLPTMTMSVEMPQ